MVGVIICAGHSTRLYPITKVLSKQLLPIYDKPLIYYPLSMLMKAGITKIALVTNEENISLYKKLLGNGKQLGIRIFYFIDQNPQGTASSFNCAKDFIKNEKVCLVLGDNFFYGKDFETCFKKASSFKSGSVCFGYPVEDASKFGVAYMDDDGKVLEIEEKPCNPKSNLAITGIYFYDEKCSEFLQKVEVSKRQEYEITDLNKIYLSRNELKLIVLSKENIWIDTGTSQTLLEASNFVFKTQSEQNIQIACLEEIAYSKKYISQKQLYKLYLNLQKTSYGKYLEKYLNL